MAKRYEPMIKQPAPNSVVAILAKAEAGYRINQQTQLP